MFGVDDGNSLGLGCLIIFNLHFVFEVVLVIVQMMLIRSRSSNGEGIRQLLWPYASHLIVWACLLAAFFAIFQDKPSFMIPQIILQICVIAVATLNVFSWIYLSPARHLVVTELRSECSPKPGEDHFILYVKIVMGCLFVMLYYCSLKVVYSYYRKLRKDAKFKKPALKLKSLVVNEEEML